MKCILFLIWDISVVTLFEKKKLLLNCNFISLHKFTYNINKIQVDHVIQCFIANVLYMKDRLWIFNDLTYGEYNVSQHDKLKFYCEIML